MNRNPLHDPTALESQPEPAWLWDPGRDRMVWANRAGLAFWGEPTLIDLIDRRFDASLEAVRQIAEIASEIAPGEWRRRRFVFQLRTGEHALTAQCRRLKLDDGRDGLLMVAVADEAGEHDDTRARLFGAVIDCLPVAVAVFDRHGGLVYANAECRGLTAGAGEEGQNVLAGWLGDDARARELIDQGLASGTVSETETLLTRFGPRAHRVTVKRLSAPIYGRLALVFVFDDVEDRRRLALRQEGALRALEAALAAATDVTFTLDAEARLTAMSPGSDALFGVDGANFIGQPWAEAAPGLGIVLAAATAADLAAMRRVSGAVVGLAHAGEGARALFNAEPVCGADGAAVALRCTLSRIAEGQASRDEATEPAPAADPLLDDDATFSAIARAIAAHAEGDPAQPPPPGAGAEAEAGKADAPAGPAEDEAARSLALRIVGGVDHSGGAAEALGLERSLDAAALDHLDEPALVHRVFSVVGANARFAALIGDGARPADPRGANLLNLFPEDRSRLFALQNRFDDDTLARPGEVATLAMHIARAGAEPAEVTAGIERVLFEGEPALLMRFAGAADLARDGGRAGTAAERPSPRSTARSAPVERAAVAAAVSAHAPADADQLEAPREREDELRAILNSAADGIVTLDGEGRIKTFNPSAEAIFARQAIDVVGQTLSSLLDPESARTVDAYLQSVGERSVAGLYREGREVTATRADGTTVPLFLTIGPMKVENGPKFCAVIRDITQWKRSESELLRARDEAEQASSKKSDFLARISHELRTPLNAIIGFSEVMSEEKFGPIANDRYKGYLVDIRASGEHLLSLINDLLDLSKIEAGKLELNFGSVVLAPLIQQCIKLMQPQAARERVIMRVSTPDDLPAVVADERALRQILLNLLSNAIKFTPPGGQVIVSTVLDDDGPLQIRIRDTGRGMTADELKQALEPFRQIDLADAHTAIPGTGLGLPLTKALTEANRAELRIESTPGAGTLVQVIFPPERVLAG